MKSKFSCKIISLILVLATLITTLPLTVFADEIGDSVTSAEPEIYIKDIKLVQAKTSEEARRELEAMGYAFLDGNLNEGTGADGIWMGYLETADPAEAIYDLKVMNTKGGFTITSAEDALKEQETAFAQMATDLNYLIEAFVEAYEVGDVAALKAYKALNFFRMISGETELEEENGLGYQIVNGAVSLSEITEILMLCDSDIVDSIVKILTSGIQLRNENWMDKLSAKGPYDADKDYGDDEAEIKRRAEQLLVVLKFYAKAYNAMDASGLLPDDFDENGDPVYTKDNKGENLPAEEAETKKVDESRYKLYKVVFDELAKYKYGTGETLKDFFLSLAKESNARKLYPLVSVLTDGEFAALSYGCFIEIACGVTAKAEDFDNYDEVYEDLTEDVKSVYLYHGVDKALLADDSIIGFTDAASRHMATTGELEFFENETDGENAWETGKQVAKCIGALGMAVMGIAKITFGATMLISGISTTVAASVKSGMLAGVMKFCTMISGGYALLVVAGAVLLTIIIASIVMAYHDAEDDEIDWENYPIPEYLYDVKEINLRQTSVNDGISTETLRKPVFVFYEAVTDLDGHTIDLNAYSDDATQWLSLYVSYDRQGDDAKPIKATDLLVKTGNGETPEGYEALTSFAQVVPYDLNRWDEEDEVNGVYLFYKQDKGVVVESNVTHYIYDVYLQVGESDAHCIDLLLAAGYTPLNVNLTPDVTDDDLVGADKIYTYLGYKTTTSESSAIRDLRFEYGPSQGEVRLGGATYAECGSNGYVTLYATKYKSAGTPILAGGIKHLTSRNDAPLGYEPVNFFSGGPATNIDVGSKGIYYKGESYLYFLPKTTFTSGKAYLSGVAYVSYLFDALYQPLWESSDNEYVTEYLKQYTGWEYKGEYIDWYISAGKRWVPSQDNEASALATYQFINHKAGYDYIYGIDNKYVPYYDREEDCVWDVVMYSKTYNPYRAIYDIKGTSVDESQPKLNLESVGYTSWAISHWDEHYVINPDSLYFSHCYLTFNTCPGAAEADLGSRLYVTGNPSSNNEYDETEKQMKEVQPIALSDFQCVLSGSGGTNKTSLQPVTDVFTDSKEAIVFKNEKTNKAFSFYFANNVQERPYVSSVTAVDKLTLIRGFGGYASEIEYRNITDSMMLSQLASQGATNFSGTHIEFYHDSDVHDAGGVNALKFGYTRSAEPSEALRDMFFYFNGFSDDEPPKELCRGNVKYKLICEIPYSLVSYEEAPKMGVYLYGTTDSRAGNRIIDLQVTESPFLWGYETVRTMDGGSLVTEMRNYADTYANKHIFSYAGDLFDRIRYFFGDDEYTGETENKLYYFHVKREGDSLKQQKPYIGEVYVAFGVDEEAALEQLFHMGAEYYVNMDLNSGTVIHKSSVFMGYSYTADPDDSIKGLVAYHESDPPKTLTDSSGCDYYLVSDVDLNKYALGDYIYLYATKETVHNSDPIVSLNADKVVGVGMGYMNWIDGSRMPVKANCTKRWGTDAYSDLNRWAGGDYVYLMYNTMRTDIVGSYTEKEYGPDQLYTRSPITDMSAEGKYIGALYVMDKNTIRQEKLAAGVASDACTCDMITDREVFDRLRAMGATTIIETPIQISGDAYENNNNKVFIGYSRTNNSKKAIKNIAIKAETTSLKEPPEGIKIDRNYKLVAEAAADVKELPRAINLIGIQDGQDMPLPRMYLYYSTEGSAEPIRDICIDSDPLKNGWNTARSDGKLDPFADIYAQALKQYELAEKEWKYFNGKYTDAYLCWIYTKHLMNSFGEISDDFDPEDAEAKPFYIHMKRYDTKTLEETKPYIGQVFIAAGDSRHEALSSLVAFEPDGFIDIDLNEDAGGDYVYLGYKRVAKASDAITDIVVFQGKNPATSRRVKIGEKSVKYTLAADVDLNKDAGGKWLYLYTTDSDNTGNPIKNLEISNTYYETPSVKCGIEWLTVMRAEGDKITNEWIDLCKGAGGDYLYMHMQRETTEGHNGEDTGKFKEKLPTCGADGYYTKYMLCKDCGVTYEKTTVKPATGDHVDAEGDGNHKCDGCGKKSLTSHVRGEAKTEKYKAATEDTDGSYSIVYYCVECNSKLSETKVTIPAGTSAPEQFFGASVVGDGSVIAICSLAAIAIIAATIIYIVKKKEDNE